MTWQTDRRSAARIGTAAALTALLLASGMAAADEPKLEVSTLRYQSSSGADISPLELADALGYLKPLTLNRLGDVQGGPAALQATATGQTDISSAFNGAVLNIIAAGAPLTAVVGWRGTNVETSPGLFVLDNGKVNSARDLIGSKVGVNTLGANQEAVADIYLAKNGLSRDEIKKVTFVPLPTPNVEQALRNNQIGAGSLGLTFRSAAEARGGVKPLFLNVDLIGTYTDNTGVLRNDFIKKNPNATRHLVTAIARAIAWAQERENDQHRDEVIALMTKYLENTGRPYLADQLKLWRSLGIATNGGWIKKDDFNMWVDWLDSRGEIDARSFKLETAYTNAFNPYWPGQE
jgi:ABC-type nitrate/sulfonate/bicarbonate transport system substrate-binding protein